jgi:protocatechuate 3,4-dioxygenase beta subunit
MPNRKLSLSLLSLATFVSLLIPVTLAAQTTDSRTKPTGSISGRVSINGKPATDVVVVAQFQDRAPLQQPPARAKTDSNGHYRISGLSAGQYQISVVAPALANVDASSPSFYGSSKPVVLSSAEEVEDIDIKLVKGGVITGRVTDADDKPVVEQRVNLQIVDHSGNIVRPVDSLVSYQMSNTDDRGIYRIFGLSPGRYRVSVGATENGISTTNSHAVYPLTYYGATNDPNRATIVDLQEGSEATNIDIRLGRAGNSFVATGRVIDTDSGQPIPGVRVIYGPARQGEQFYGGFVGLPTGPRGEFRVEGLEPGKYGLTLAAVFVDSGSFYSEPIFFNVTDGDVTNLELKATRGLTLSGVVVFEGSRAKELQSQISAFRMIASVTSTATPRSNQSSSGQVAPDGAFQVSGIRPGRVNLFLGAFTGTPLRGATIVRVERGGVDVTKGFEMQPGESISDLRVTAALGAGTIRGTVRIVGGELPTNARLFVSVRREGGTPAGNGVVDARGRFVLSNLTAGVYEVTLMLSLNQPGPRPPMQPQKQTVNVSEEGETPVDFIVDLTPKEGGP